MKLKNLFILFYCTIPLVVIVRVFQLTQMIDPETGFYYEMFRFGGTLIAGAIVALTAVFVILGRLNDKWPACAPERDKALGVLSGGVALGLVLELADFVREMAAPGPADAYRYLAGEEQRGQAASFFGNAAYFIFLVAAAAFFIFWAYGQIAGKKTYMLLSVAPILWAALRLGRTFMLYTGIADISENVFDIMMLCLMLVFWLLHGRIVSGYNYGAAVKWIFGVGLSAALLSVICTLPRLYVLLFGKSIILHESTAPKLINIASAVYIWYFLYRFSKQPAGKPEPAADAAPKEEKPPEDGASGDPPQE